MEKREMYKKVLLYFFAAMLVFTVISRMADSLTIPKVSVQKPGSGRLEYHIKGEGNVEITKQKTYLIPEGYLVESCKSDGSCVKKGDVLVQFQMDQLKQKKQQCEQALKKAQVTLEQTKLGVQQDAWVPQTDAASRALAYAREDLSKQNQTVNGMISAQTEDQMQQPQVDEEILDQAKKTVRDAEGTLLDAQKSDAVTRENEKRSQQNAEFTVKLQKFDVQEAKKNVKAVNQLVKNQGCLKAKKAGIFFNTMLHAGTMTTGSEYVAIGSEGYALSAEISKEEMGKLKQGDAVEVKINGMEPIQTEIDSLSLQQRETSNASGVSQTESDADSETNSAEDTGEETYMLHAQLPDSLETYHPYASFLVEKESEETFDAILPKTAIREDEKGTFCLVTEQKDSILGETIVAKRVSLKIEKETEDQAAVSGALGPDENVIIASKKDIQENDRVRIGDD
ncbi:MAG: hypothetical protein ACI4HI_07975 [Lachnospiraceae bacterium]